MTESDAIRRKRLRFQSWHRGCKETDLVLGQFADAHLGRFSPDDLDRYEAILGESDADIYAWLTGRSALPRALDTNVMRLLLSFNIAT